jgi:hypothetical protein
VISSISVFGAAKQYQLQVDPQALVVAQATFAAMGGVQALGVYQDSVSSGTVTCYSEASPISYSITLKSKGLRKTRVELQLPKGLNVRIANGGQAAIVRPDGSIKQLSSNNTFYEHVNHVPLLSLLSEYAGGNVNLLYKGTGQVQGQSENIIEIDYVPNLDPVQGPILASMSRTLFFVNQSTNLVDKIQSTPVYEGSDKNTYTEEVYLSGYQSVVGMLVPSRQTVFVNGQLDSDFQFSSITGNVGLPDSEFSLPQ